MNKIIYKYHIDRKDCPNILMSGPGEPFECNMHKNAKIIAVKAQNHYDEEQAIIQTTGKIWAIVDENEKEIVKRKFVLVPTGFAFNDLNLQYIETYSVNRGNYIIHLFEVV